jgi:SOS-response transcriptional repressor LexA
MFDVAKVDGISMSPSLMNGDLLLFSKRQQFVVGDIVLYRVGSGLLLVKRVDEIKNGIINLASDNRWVESSLCLTGLSSDGVIGVVLASLSRRRNFKVQIHSRPRSGFTWKRLSSGIFSTRSIKI